jgi:NAD+ synthetase
MNDSIVSHTDSGPLRLALIQFRPKKADPTENLLRVAEQLRAQAGTADLVVFPEAALSGYFLEGGVGEAARSVSEVAAGLGPAGEGAPDAVVGFYERWRQRLYNAVGYFEATPDGYRALHVHRKLFLPTYGVFDEDRFVEAGRELRPVHTRFGCVGLLICEDLWHGLPATALALAGAELLVVVSASPARDFTAGAGEPANLTRWTRLATTTAEEHGVFVAVAQLVGSEGGKLFPGGSVVVAPDGEVMARGPLLDEGVVEASLHGVRIERTRADAPMLADLEKMLPHLQRALRRASGHPSRGEATARGSEIAEHRRDEGRGSGLRGGGRGGAVIPSRSNLLDLDLDMVESALVRFIRDEVVERRGFGRVVVGVSGGVDSAVSLFLACRALGPENVFGFRLPYRTSSPDSLSHAELAFRATGAQSRTIDISGAVDGYLEAAEPDADGLRRGNVMARTRAVVLFDQSAKLRALPLGTGNKSERLLGYYTWHADDSPPINPLGDLFKTQVWALARHLGVPTEIVDKPASADLVRGVHDEHELGITYPAADPILYWLVRGYTASDLVRSGFDPGQVDLVDRRLSSTHWKRERPTVAVLSSSAIGAFYLRPVDF